MKGDLCLYLQEYTVWEQCLLKMYEALMEAEFWTVMTLHICEINSLSLLVHEKKQRAQILYVTLVLRYKNDRFVGESLST